MPCTPLGPFGPERLMSYMQGRARNGTRAHARPGPDGTRDIAEVFIDVLRFL